MDQLWFLLNDMRKEWNALEQRVQLAYRSIDEYVADHNGTYIDPATNFVAPFVRRRAAEIARYRSHQIPLGHAIDRAESWWLEEDVKISD
jgi:hypothetical protein